MLSELRIRNFALIDELQVSFGEGLNVITGETGAGKSIIIGAISLLLGDRASTEMIRSAEEMATVEASFQIAEMGFLKEKLREMDLEGGEELIIKRTISRSGKNKVNINGSIASLAILSSLCESLINICGQHEHQVMLNKEKHLDLLDDFGGLKELRGAYEVLYEQYRSWQGKLVELEEKCRRNMEEEEFRKYQLGEITAANLAEQEEESLLEEKKMITHARKLLAYAEEAEASLYSKEGSVLEELRRAMANIREIRKIDEKLPLEERDVEGTYYHLEDMALTLRNYAKGLSCDESRLAVIEERLELLGSLKRKYGGTLEAVLQKKLALENSLSVMTSLHEERARLGPAIDKIRCELEEEARHLSEKRKKSALRLAAGMDAEIRSLRMEKAAFHVHFHEPDGEPPSFHSKGIDDVEFYLSTNIGEEAKPLARIASGGELSRIVLAMKKIMAKTGQVGTIIFDEVDSGIGGATAGIVGEKLKDVAGKYQVLCITHLPQIACFGSRHFLVSKEEKGERTKTGIRFLSEEERLEEITRMLAGVEITEKARAHAREMLAASRLSQS